MNIIKEEAQWWCKLCEGKDDGEAGDALGGHNIEKHQYRAFCTDAPIIMDALIKLFA